MTGSLNKVTLIGNVGQDPRTNTTNDNRKIASFSLATTESWKDKNTGERKSKSDWHNIVVYNDGLAKVVETYVKKGSKLYIEGALQTRKYTDKDGVEKYTTEVVLQNFGGTMIMLDSKPAATPDTNAPMGDELGDEIPFAFLMPYVGVGLCMTFLV